MINQKPEVKTCDTRNFNQDNSANDLQKTELVKKLLLQTQIKPTVLPHKISENI